MAKSLGLGRGLGALITEVPKAEAAGAGADGTPREEIAIERIRKGVWQPRRDFDKSALSDLAASIAQHGILQPLLVRSVGDMYEIIAGERRFRAAREAGLTAVPVVIVEAADREALELALIENLQREDLNPIEEAEGYQQLAEKFSLTQEEIARQVGKGRATIANALRLLALAAGVQEWLAEGRLSVGHAKVLLGVEIEAEQESLARRVVLENLSVRELERLLAPRRRSAGRKKGRAPASDLPEHHIEALSDRLRDHFGTAVHVQPCRTLPNGKKAKGTLQLDFHSNEELDRLLERMGLEEAF